MMKRPRVLENWAEAQVSGGWYDRSDLAAVDEYVRWLEAELEKLRAERAWVIPDGTHLTSDMLVWDFGEWHLAQKFRTVTVPLLVTRKPVDPAVEKIEMLISQWNDRCPDETFSVRELAEQIAAVKAES